MGVSYSSWDISGSDNYTAEVFRMDKDQGMLLNGNTLCGAADPGQQTYAVFYEKRLFDLSPDLHLSIFQSAEPPHDGSSPGTCATFTYEIAVAAEPAKPETRGAWRKSEKINPIDDSKTVTLALAAESGTSRSGEPITFIARCQSNTTEAYAVWGDYLGDDSNDVYSEWKRVTVRIGSDKAHEQKWTVSTDRQATFAPDWSANLLKKLLDQDRLVLQTTPYGQSPVTAIFDITGLRSVLGDLAETCNWTF